MFDSLNVDWNEASIRTSKWEKLKNTHQDAHRVISVGI